jgi:hypothetical protein
MLLRDSNNIRLIGIGSNGLGYGMSSPRSTIVGCCFSIVKITLIEMQIQ